VIAAVFLFVNLLFVCCCSDV